MLDIEENLAVETEARAESAQWLQRLLRVRSAAELRDFIQLQHRNIIPRELDNIIIIGAADEGKRLIDICLEYNISVAAWCDENPQKLGQQYREQTVISVQDLCISNVNKEFPVILATHRVLKPYNRLTQLGFKNVAPFALLQVLTPELFAPHMFYDRWLEDLIENKAEIIALSEILADDFSREVLDAVLGFRMTLDPKVLEPIIEWELYGPNDLLEYSDDEVYIDGGTFDGDSIKLFIQRVENKFARIIGFEPDTNTFKVLCENFKNEPRVEPVNKGLFSHTTVLKFDNAGTRGSILTEDGPDTSISVPVISVDEYLNGDRVSYIKMNIEGAEIAALNGASKSIKQFSPKLAISVYHRASDLWQIPKLIHALNPKYKLYLRQHDGGVIETVIFAKT